MKKKLLSVLLSAAMLAAVLAGCGSSAPAPAESTGNDASVPAAESSQAAETGSEDTEAAQADPASLGPTRTVRTIWLMHSTKNTRM